LIDLPEPSHTVTLGRPFAAIPGAKRHQTLKKLYKLLETLIDLPEPSHTVTLGRPFAAIPGAKRHQSFNDTRSFADRA